MLLGACVLFGCTSQIKTEPYRAGKVWVLPVQDAVQGKSGEAVAGSGKAFQNALVDNFSKTPFKTVVSHNKQFDSASGLRTKGLLSEARNIGADYCLLAMLGEVHTAKPGAMKPDYAYLGKAGLYDVRSGKMVWKLSKPLYVEKGNKGNPSLMFKVMAAYVTDSIAENAK